MKYFFINNKTNVNIFDVKHYYVEHIENYQLIKFDKNNIDIIKHVKSYEYRNFNDNTTQLWINEQLNNFDFGFTYFSTNVVKTTKNNKIINIQKYKPCAYIIIKKILLTHICLLHMNSLCSKKCLDTKLINILFEYCKYNNYKNITTNVAVNSKLVKFYENNGFVVEKNLNDTKNITIYMKKNI